MVLFTILPVSTKIVLIASGVDNFFPHCYRCGKHVKNVENQNLPYTILCNEITLKLGYSKHLEKPTSSRYYLFIFCKNPDSAPILLPARHQTFSDKVADA